MTYLLSSVLMSFLNPALQTVLIGTMSFAIKCAIASVTSICFWEPAGYGEAQNNDFVMGVCVAVLASLGAFFFLR